MAQRFNAEEAAARILSFDTDDDLSDEVASVPDEDPDGIEKLESDQLSVDGEGDNTEEESDSSNHAQLASRFVGRNGTAWNSVPPSMLGRTPSHNLFTATDGVPRSVSRTIQSPYEAWKHIIDESILRAIVKHTTQEAIRNGDNNFTLSIDELENFISLQYARGLYGKNHPASFLWNKNHGIPVFPNVMPRDRFIKILRYLRFDDKTQRVTSGCKIDKFSPIRDIFSTFVSMCQSKYVCKYSLTIDEQLMPLKSRCSFITFMPNKPDKYGLKFWALCDVETKYVLNIIPYLGANERDERGSTPLAESVVMKLVEPIKNKGYNICCDNFFTSLPLAQKLASCKISIVGTIRKNRRELSNQITEPVKDENFKCFFLWHEDSNAMFVRYQPKPRKSVCLLSTMHIAPDIHLDTEKKKPEVIHFYNKNKTGVDCFDQMTRLYTSRSASRRWPLAVWANMLDIAAINARIIFMKSVGKSVTRRNFILQLIETLRHPQPAPAIATPAPVLLSSQVRKRHKCHRQGCNNATLCFCQECGKPTCGSCSQAETKITYVKCNGCNQN